MQLFSRFVEGKLISCIELSCACCHCKWGRIYCDGWWARERGLWCLFWGRKHLATVLVWRWLVAQERLRPATSFSLGIVSVGAILSAIQFWGWYLNFRGLLIKEDSITSPCEGKHPAPVLVVQICSVPLEILGQEQLSPLALFVWEPSPDIFWRWYQVTVLPTGKEHNTTRIRGGKGQQEHFLLEPYVWEQILNILDFGAQLQIPEVGFWNRMSLLFFGKECAIVSVLVGICLCLARSRIANQTHQNKLFTLIVFRWQHLLFCYHLQKRISLGFEPKQKVPGQKPCAGLYLSWAASHPHHHPGD